MAHTHSIPDYTIANQVRAMVEENTEQWNRIADLNRDLREARADLLFVRKERQRLEEKLARIK